MKKINLLHLHHWFFPGKFMNFSEAATGGVLWKKPFLKISQYSQVEFWEIFKSTYFKEHLLTASSDLLKQLKNSGELLLLYRLLY